MKAILPKKEQIEDIILVTFDKNGKKVTGEQVIQGAKYNFGSDGKIVTSALNFLNITEEELLGYIKKKKTSLDKIYFMTLTKGMSSIIIDKEQYR